MDKKLRDLISINMFEHIVLQGKRGIFTKELLKIGENIWNAAQEDVLRELEKFQEEEEIIIITRKDWSSLKKLNKSDKEHIKANEKLRDFINLKLKK